MNIDTSSASLNRATTIEEDDRWTSADMTDALDVAHRLALTYLTSLGSGSVSQHASPTDMTPRFNVPMPEHGCLPGEAVREWMSRAEPGIVRSPGPRYFGFVTGGATPAALAGDWLASALDQNASMWLQSPAAAQTELTVIRWLLELFGLPAGWSGVLTSGATMANLCGLAAARQWASQRLGFDASLDGIGGRSPIPVVGSTDVHHSALKALSILGIGRGSLEAVVANEGAIDLAAFDLTLSRHDGPLIVIANAGEVNTGAFDNLQVIAERCANHPHGAWLHVDGAFGLYAALSSGHRHLLDGIAQADSVATDAHKWLNVPYDCGVAFVRDRRYLQGAFSGTAAYLSSENTDTMWNGYEHVPELSRRFRALSVWCALRAGGASGYREIVEQSLANARAFASWVSNEPNLEMLAPVHLNIACFRLVAATRNDNDSDAITARAVDNIQRGGVAYVTGTRWQGRAAIRAAFDNWATRATDVIALQQAVADAATALCG